MPQYRPKNLVFGAIKWDGDTNTANAFFGERYGVDWVYIDAAFTDTIRVGLLEIKAGTWVTKANDGTLLDWTEAEFLNSFEPNEGVPANA